MKSIFYIHFFLVLLISEYSAAQQKTVFRGTVFLDENANGVFDKNKKGVKDVCVSNGKDVVQTNEKGEWKIEAASKKSVFVIKPAGFAVPVNKNQIPLHFNQEESSVSAVINFPLLKQNENKKFSALFFGDTQARGMKEVNYIFHDVVEELIGSKAHLALHLAILLPTTLK